MNFNTTLIVLFLEILVVVSGSWLFVTCLGYLRSTNKHHYPSMVLLLLGAGVISTAFFVRILVHQISDPHGVGGPTLDELLTVLSVGIGCICINVALINHLKSETDSKNTLPITGESNHFEAQDNIRSATQKQLDHNLKKFTAVFENCPAPLIVTDIHQQLVKVNRAFIELLNLPVESLKDHYLSEFVVKEDQTLLDHFAPEKIGNKSYKFEIDLRLINQEAEPCWVKIVPRIINLEDDREFLLLLVQDISESKNLAEIIQFHSEYDELTMLHNRAGLEAFLEKALQNDQQDTQNLALIYIDIDQLKVVNDTCGHSAGDKLLQHLVTTIGEASKNCDFFARVGGDEFALVKRNTHAEEAAQIAESVRGAAEDFTFVWNGNRYRQSISIGVALSSKVLCSVVDLIGAADAACSAAKDAGKNRVEIFAGTIDASKDSRHDMMWVSRLQKAIQDGAFELYFQPIEKLSDIETSHVHYELLIRYVDEAGRHITPQYFLPAVERFGFSEQIDLWVITTALDYLDKHPKHTEILNCCSINLTSQSIANPRIRSAILQVVKSYNFPSEKICFEITESSAIRNLNDARDFVRELKTLGCHLALDDFGTGFSSFGYLKNLEVDYIKIDGSFVRDIISDRFDRAMVSAINNIGQEMGISTIAEYAENLNIIQALEKMDVGFAQGYGIARPMPINELESFYSKK